MRKGRAVALVVLALLATSWAGCLSSEDPGQGDGTSPGPGLAPSCGDVCEVRTSEAGGVEPEVAIDPTDPDHLIVGAIESSAEGYTAWPLAQGPGWAYLSVRVSEDGGRTWERVPMPYAGTAESTSMWNQFCVEADPVALFDPGGTAYLFGIGWPCTGSGMAPGVGSTPMWPSDTSVGHVWMATSQDGGYTWSEPVIVERSPGVVEWPDKPWAALDPEDPDHLLVSWVGIQKERGFYLRYSLSEDGGATWSEPGTITGPPESAFYAPVPAFGQDGAMHVAYAGCANACLVVATSQDGSTWETTEVAEMTPVDRQGAQAIAPWKPVVAVDRSTGTLWTAWHTLAADGSADVQLSSSSDGGSSWTQPRTVNDNGDDGTDQFLPWLAAADGKAHLFFYDRRVDPAENLKVRATYAIVDEATGRITNVPASDPWHPDPNEAGSVFWGDYQTIDASGDRAVLAWTQQDQETGVRHIHTSVFSP